VSREALVEGKRKIRERERERERERLGEGLK